MTTTVFYLQLHHSAFFTFHRNAPDASPGLSVDLLSRMRASLHGVDEAASVVELFSFLNKSVTTHYAFTIHHH